MTQEIIWMSNEARALIYEDNGFGEKTSEDAEPIFEYCYFQDIVLTGTLIMNREPVTGRAVLKIVAQAYEYELSVEHWFIHKVREFDLENVFNRNKKLIIELQMQHGGEEPEVHTLRLAMANMFSIKLQDNREASGSAKFSAELYD